MVEDAKKFFSYCRCIDMRVQAKLDEIARYRDILIKITPSMSDMPGSGGDQNKIENCVTRICALEDEISKEIDTLIDCRRIAMVILGKIRDDRYKDILVLRYFSGYSWAMVGARMNYERTNIWRIHGYALVAAQNAMSDLIEEGGDIKEKLCAILKKVEHNETSNCDMI